MGIDWYRWQRPDGRSYRVSYDDRARTYRVHCDATGIIATVDADEVQRCGRDHVLGLMDALGARGENERA